MENANNSTMKIQGEEKFEGLDSVLCESAGMSLFSSSQFTREKDAAVIISKMIMLVNSLLNDIKNHSFNKKILLAAKHNNNNLYELCGVNSIQHNSSNQKPNFTSSPVFSHRVVV